MRILHLVPALGYRGTTKQMATLALGLPRDRFEVRVGTLRDEPDRLDGSLKALLQQGGVPVHVLGKPRRLDPLAVWSLRRLLHAFRPEVIHAWGATCLRLLTVAGCRSAPPVVATDLLPAMPKRAPVWWQRWLLKGPACIMARGEAEAARYLRAGAKAGNIVPVPPAVPALPLTPHPSPLTAHRSPPRFALCAGAMEPHKGFGNAIWTLDILRILFDDLHLVLVGDGPDRPHLERFAQGIQLADCVHFFGRCADIRPFLNRAEMVWVPSLGDCGLHITLEALAAGKPVLASNVPSLRELIRDGETGFLIPPGDKPALGRRTRQLLRAPHLARQIGEAGRQYAAPFTPARLVERMAEVYRELGH